MLSLGDLNRNAVYSLKLFRLLLLYFFNLAVDSKFPLFSNPGS